MDLPDDSLKPERSHWRPALGVPVFAPGTWTSHFICNHTLANVESGILARKNFRLCAGEDGSCRARRIRGESTEKCGYR